MSVEEYKKAVVIQMKILQPKITTEEIDDLMTMSDDAWKGYMKDFSPEIAAQGFLAGLI